MQVLVTGGTGGIGFAIASHFAAQGHKVVLADLQQNSIDSKVAELKQQGFAAEGIVLDVTDAASIANCAAEYPADVLINNAGIQHVARLEDFPPEKWQLLLNVMLTGPAMLSRAMLPGMRERNFGRIINIGSIHALVASPFKSAYVAAKHGLLGFSKVVALENGDLAQAKDAYGTTLELSKASWHRNPVLYATLARTQLACGEKGEAMKTLASLRRDYKYKPEGEWMADVLDSQIQQHSGNKQQAEKLLQSAAERLLRPLPGDLVQQHAHGHLPAVVA